MSTWWCRWFFDGFGFYILFRFTGQTISRGGERRVARCQFDTIPTKFMGRIPATCDLTSFIHDSFSSRCTSNQYAFGVLACADKLTSFLCFQGR